MLLPHSSASEDLRGEGGILDHELLEGEGREAGHCPAASVHLNVVQALKSATEPLLRPRGDEAEVAGGAVFLVLDRRRRRPPSRAAG